MAGHPVYAHILLGLKKCQNPFLIHIFLQFNVCVYLTLGTFCFRSRNLLKHMHTAELTWHALSALSQSSQSNARSNFRKNFAISAYRGHLCISISFYHNYSPFLMYHVMYIMIFLFLFYLKTICIDQI